MLSAIFLINSKGEIVIYRLYRDDISIAAANQFRLQVIAAKEAGSAAPVRSIDGNTFLYIRHKDMFFVGVTRSNANASLVFAFLYAMVDIFKGYFEEDFDEDSLKDNFTLVYELLDEVLDYGYPQNSSLDVLKMYINLGSLKVAVSSADEKKMTSMITGARDWRREGIVHKKNEVFLDVNESVNLLVSTSGAVLRNDVTGQVVMKCQLSGMPECKLGLNDKLVLDKDAGGKGAATGAGGKKKPASVELDDVQFHRCVQLGKFDADRTITFVPPDGDFELMKYRITDNVNLPFRIIPVIEEQGKTRVVMNIKAIANFSSQLFASNVALKIPVPNNTARCKITVGIGSASYKPEVNAIVWKIRRFPGGQEAVMNGEIELIMSTKNKAWVRPPITADFQVPMFTASGLHVRSLKMYERSNYQTTKWVRYLSRSGSYQIKI
jgi:AP-2 complex subunit mu-1